MQIKCEYCGSMIEETADKCPFCGATNNAVKRTADKTPKTIAELQQWYQDRHLPPYETTRFFIGINYKKPKAFGIYQDGDQFIVYKNKANGERAIRYQGTDEAYAVNELYLKLKSEILNQKANNQTRKQQQTLTREQGISEGEAFEQMRGMYQAMREADDNYDGKLKSASGLVGTDGEKMHAAREAGTLLCGKFIGKVMEKALKTGESNACMKRIVAAPTAGSCGVVPAVFLTLEEEKHFSEEKMVEALYVAASSLYTKTRQTANVPSAIRARMKLMLSMNFI
jgi:rubrerythrin